MITALAVLMIVAPTLLSQDNHMADAHKKKHHHGQHHDKSNFASQSIRQSQSSSQNSQVVSGGSTFNSGNNINVQSQKNTGSNVLAQQ